MPECKICNRHKADYHELTAHMRLAHGIEDMDKVVIGIERALDKVVASPTPEIGQGVRMGDIEKSKVDTMTMQEVAKRLADLQAEHDKLKAENTKLREDSKVREPLPATSKFEVKGKRMILGFDLEDPKPSKAGKASIRYAQSWRKVGDYTVNLLVLDAKRKS